LTDFCASLAALALVVFIGFPALANSRVRSERLVCLSNLGEIGKGYNMWASDHGDLYPFLLRKEQGGIRTPYNGLEINAWFQFSWVSNELSSARVLACPSDATKQPARDFSLNPGGLLHPNYRADSISYFLSRPSFPTGYQVLCGDRNVVADAYGQPSAIFGPSAVAVIFNRPSSRVVRWTPSIHHESGNLLYRDGSVIQAGNVDLRRATSHYHADNGLVELLLP
jgi:hypothetical protein